MLGKKRRFKDLDLTELVNTDIVLTNVSKPIALRTQVFDKSNAHGTYTSPTLASGRLFTFTGQAFGNTKAERRTARKKIIDAIQPEHNPNTINRGFYDLTRETDGGVEVTVKAKVYRAPEPDNGLGDPIIDFSFDLYAETERVSGTEEKSETGSAGVYIGTPLESPLSSPLSGYAGYIECENEGNWPAPVKIEIVGSALNPKLINLTNNRKYKIGNYTSPYTTTSLVYDNRNEDNDPTKQLVATDLGTNIKSKRTQGGDIYLEPGVNQFIVLIDNYDNDGGNPVVTVTWNDSYFLN